MDITWLGHSCFRIKGKEATVVTDPFSSAIGYSTGKIKADVVTVSHEHPGHSNIEAIEGEFRVIKGPGEYELKGVFITGIRTYHDNADGKDRGKNVIYVIEIDGVTICHLGDLGHMLTSSTIEEIGDVGILFLPVGGISTIDSITASELVRTMAPKIAIPMHYKTPALNMQLDPVDKFLKKMGIKELEPQPKLTITRSSFTENTQILLLSYPNQ